MILKEELEKMYWNQGMNQYEVAREINELQSTVSYWMKKYEIVPRTYSEAQRKEVQKLSKEELEKMYWKHEMSQSEIASEIGVQSTTVHKWMKLYGIETRTLSEALLIGSHKLSKEELEEMYWKQGMTLPEIAKEVDVSIATAHRRMKKHGIEVRTPSEAMLHGNFSGEKSGAWRGGISFEPYCHKFNNTFKEAVRERDDYTCQLCGYEQKLGGQKLSIHHIHYDKENCYPDVVALCRSCNSKVNSDRAYWEQYFEILLATKGILNWTVRVVI